MLTYSFPAGELPVDEATRLLFSVRLFRTDAVSFLVTFLFVVQIPVSLELVPKESWLREGKVKRADAIGTRTGMEMTAVTANKETATEY